ncbi:MAG: hypothetical protein GKS00_10145 [Alphaproteobacteria bacterium]|nr:hypothetical protein [Alphaproteobacteria bacterium]
MCGLAHYFEDEGIPSTAIALVREHAEKMRAPRALWVPFELGRPLGAPDEPAFQRRVLSEALAMLVSPDGPVVLTDFPDDAPGPKAEDSTGWVCPVSFPPPPSEDEGPVVAMLSEIDALAPWYQVSRERRGRTLVGVSGMTLHEAARYVASFLDEPVPDSSSPDKTVAQAFKDATTDIMAYYSEAGTAQPGRRSSGETQGWFWRETTAGRVLLDVREKLLEGSDKRLKFVVAKILFPKTQGG